MTWTRDEQAWMDREKADEGWARDRVPADPPWREPQMQADLEALQTMLYPPADRSPGQAAALDQILNGATPEEREAGREALIELSGGLPPEDDDEYLDDYDPALDAKERASWEEYQADKAAGVYDREPFDDTAPLDPGPLGDADGHDALLGTEVGDDA